MNKTEELEYIAGQHKGILCPSDVVAYALDPDTALHEHFEWDDGEAAVQYRLEQARHLIRFTMFTPPGQEEPMHLWVSLRSDRGVESYRRLTDVIGHAELREQLLAEALQEAEAWARRYSRFAELKPVTRAIARAAQKFAKPKK